MTLRVVVTGANGFIGSHACRAWRERADLQLVPIIRGDAPSRDAIVADLSQPGWTQRLPDRADIVVHLAQSQRYREFPAGSDDMVRINIAATAELADWARTHGVRRFVFASTGNVYRTAQVPLAENFPCESQSFYGASKLAAERLLLCYTSWFDLCIVRLFGVYGPGQSRGMVPTLIDRLRTGQEIALAGGLGVVTAPLYVDDCVAALGQLARDDRSGGDILNIGGPQVVSLHDLAVLCAERGGWSPTLRASDGQPNYLVPDLTKANRLFGDLLRTRPADGLDRMIGSPVSA